MIKGFISIFFLFFIQQVHAQTKKFTKEEQATLDSILKDDDFFDMIKTALKPKSYFQVSAGLGNNYFSIKNKRLEAAQLESKLVFTPQVAYFHKTGMALSAGAFFSSFNGRSGFYQYSLTPSYSNANNKKNKNIALSVSYTRFFRKDGYEEAASPVQNDLFGTVYLKKEWIQPGISMGFSEGKNTTYKYVDTFFLGAQRKFTDTAKTTIHSFSISAFTQHSFEYYNLFDKDDAISIVPKLILNAGKNKYKEQHYNIYSAFFKRIAERAKSLGRLQQNTSFELQSAGCNVDVNYIIKKFGFEPQVYLDYYLPETTDKKFTCVFSFAISYTF